MHRICLLLLTFLFSLQLLAAEPERTANGFIPTVAAMQSGSNVVDGQPAFCTAESVAGADWQQPDPETLNAQSDLEDQTLPASLGALLLDWHPFPHVYPLVSDGTPVFMVLLRPPPIV